MKSLIGYGLAGLIFFTAGTAVDPGVGPQEQLSDDHAALPAKPDTPSLDVAVPPLSADRAISDALALHENRQKIPLSVFLDLIRTMERSGFERNTAISVVVALARNPNLDNLADLTVAGSLKSYQKTTNEKLDEAVTELVGYIERRDGESNRLNEKFGLLSPDVEKRIGEKIKNGNQIAAEWLIEEALLRQFNPSLAEKIFVPSDKSLSLQDTVLSGEPSGTDQQRQNQKVGMLYKAPKPLASRHIVSARIRVVRGNSSAGCCLRRVATHH